MIKIMENHISPKTDINEDELLLNTKEVAEVREILRITLGKHVDKLSDEEVNDFASTMLRVTAIVLKAKHLRTKGAT